MSGFLRFTKYRRLKRYNQIINVLIKYGFGYLVHKTGVINVFYRGRNIIDKNFEHEPLMSNPERVKKVFEELGPTFIKIGQVLSLRSDLLPAEYTEELKKLQDNTTTVDFLKLIEVLEEELGTDYEALFDQINKKPLAAASIAQVHNAVLKNGEKVAVKIMKPNVLSTIENDLNILFDIARLVEEKIEEAYVYQPVNVIEELSDAIKKELDYNKEGRNTDRFRKYFRDNSNVYAPKIYWEYTRKKVIVMEYLDGIKINDISTLQKRGFDTKKLASNLGHCFMSQVFEHGFFHADPHPGNIIVLNDGRIAFIDFGMVGIIDDMMMDSLLTLLINVVNKDIKKISDSIIKLGITREEIDITLLKRDVREFIDDYYDRSLKDIEVSVMLNEVVNIALKHGVGMPPELTMLIKAMITIESVINELHPDFVIIELFKQYAKKALRDKYSPTKITKDLKDNAEKFFGDIFDMPSQFSSLLAKINNDKIKLDIAPSNLDSILNSMHKMINRMVLAIIVAALIIGSALVSNVVGQKRILGLPIFGFIGFSFGGIIGVWIIISILRSGKI